MSKLIKMYEDLKNQNNEKLYLFKSGVFYIFIGDDAKEMSEVFNFKLTSLNENYVKCGFPSNSLDKYTNLIKRLNYDVEIIEPANNSICSAKDYSNNINIMNLLNEIASLDIDAISPKDAYDILCRFKIKCTSFFEEIHSKN